MQCPSCKRATNVYCTLNDRFPLCPSCAVAVKKELTELTTEKLLKGAAAGLGACIAVALAANLVLAAAGRKNEGASWIQAIAAIFLGMVVGRTARRVARVGGPWLQAVTVAIAVLGVFEMFAGYEVVDAISGPESMPLALAIPLSLILSPVEFVLRIFSEDWVLLMWLGFAVYDPWRTTRAAVIEIRGPFPVQVSEPPPGMAPPPPGETGDAKAAGLDFERPS